jgi:uncharacterized protein YfaS (alpha-2-macroglobulin family)
MPNHLARALAAALLLASAAVPAAAQHVVEIPPIFPPSPPYAVEVDSSGARVLLTGAPRAGAAPAPAVADALRLSARDAAVLLARVPALPAAARPDTFAFPAATPPLPRAGRTVAMEGGRETPPPQAGAGALRVTRSAPAGEAERDAVVTVAFSRPMVPLEALSASDARAVPARLTPVVPGRWRWMDVRTLVFRPDAPLPAGTRFRVDVAAGARAADGGTLPRAVSWSFSTATPRAVGAYPHRDVGALYGVLAEARPRTGPVIVIAFDAEVRADDVLRAATARVGTTPVALRAATAAELAEDGGAAAVAASLPPGRHVALRPVEALPMDTVVVVEVRRDAPPGAADPQGEVQRFRIRTPPPFRVGSVACAHGGGCAPGEPWVVRLTAWADSTTFDAGAVEVEPALPGMRAVVSGATVVISGRSAPRTTYEVRLPASLRDRRGGALSVRATRLTTGVVPPEVASPAPPLSVVAPGRDPRLALVVAGEQALRVRVYRVSPVDWPRARALVSPYHRRTLPADAAWVGRPALDTVVRVAAPGTLAEVLVPLGRALGEGPGHALVLVSRGEGDTLLVARWVQATRLSVGAVADARRLVASGARLADGRPAAGATATLLPDGGRATLGADGLASLPLPPPSRRDTATDQGSMRLLLVHAGGDTAFLPERSGELRAEGRAMAGWETWRAGSTGPRVLFHAFTDRGLYRPGEEARLKGWVRELGAGPGGALRVPPRGTRVRYDVRGPREERLGRGLLELTADGGFDAAVAIPLATSLGEAHVALALADSAEIARDAEDGEGDGEDGIGWSGTGHASFRIDEFRRPEFTVGIEAPAGPVVGAEPAEVTLRAAYFSGTPLASAPVRWNVAASPGSFAPPGWTGWSFGGGDPAALAASLDGATGPDGVHAVRVRMEGDTSGAPREASLSATVTDGAGRAWNERATVLLHPAALYPGLRGVRRWFFAGEAVAVDVAAVDLGGRARAGVRVDVAASHHRWVRGANAGWETREEPAGSCAVTTAAEPVRCTFPRARPGSYVLRARLRDDAGRLASTTLHAWVSGGVTGLAAETVGLEADRPEYAPGDTARLLVTLPFAPARGLLTVARDGIVRVEPFHAATPAHVAAVAIPADGQGNVTVRVDVTPAALPDTTGAGWLSAEASLPVPPHARALRVTAAARDTVAGPGDSTRVEVEVRDARGRPVAGAEAAVVVVDEAVLAMIGHGFADPLETFHPARPMAAAVALAAPFVTGPPVDFTPAPGVVVGRVTDAASGEPVPGATLEMAGRARTSDALGRFRFSGVPAGDQVLRVVAPATRDVAVQVGAGPTPPVEVPIDVPPDFGYTLARRLRGFATLSHGYVDVQSRAVSMDLHEIVVTGAGADGDAEGPIGLRSDFRALAVFAPVVRTDADGRASVAVTLPASLTRYRVVAVAAADTTRFGVGAGSLRVRRALAVRPSPPRFLHRGDRFTLPVVVENDDDAPADAVVAARGVGVGLDSAAWRVRVPARGTATVRLAGRAETAGEARIQVAASAGARTDAAEVALPVWTPGAAEVVAAYGTIDGDDPVRIPVAVPAGALPGVGGVEVSTASTALGELTEAFRYLAGYPYGCTEQVASRLLGLVALHDVLPAVNPAGTPSADAVRAEVARDVRALGERMNDDGGFGYWSREGAMLPYASLHAAHALARAKAAGFEVPAEMLDEAMDFVEDLSSGGAPEEMDVGPYAPDGDDRPEVEATIRAYALYVRALDARDPTDDARFDIADLVRERGVRNLPVETAAWLLSALAAETAAHDGEGDDSEEEEEEEEDGAPGEAEDLDDPRVLRRALLRRVTDGARETAATASFERAEREWDWLLLSSGRRTDAAALDALLAAEPRGELVAKTVRGLLAGRTAGRWETTQENAWVLLALGRYFRAFEAGEPAFDARVWLGERLAGSHAFRGRTADVARVELPLATVAAAGSPAAVTVAREGSGRLYWRTAMRWTPAVPPATPDDRGFAVTRTYEAVDDSADVRRAADGTWHVRAGARVRVRVSVHAPALRHHVALTDPLPAGFEPLNPELRGADAVERSPDGTAYRWWRWDWDHRNLRDARAEAFAARMSAGEHAFTYLAVASTPGTYAAPPPRAEEMYHPETFGRGVAETVVVEPAR